ncbi:Uncharacterised protein [Bordetella pertussis]|nr:Uncharacterised protein [Bordetella pertussis]CFU60530.1 Uncharacterised protein [Bordetella pertussis]CPL45740.1 Uncharacterised protein [Bordetella pertussis]
MTTMHWRCAAGVAAIPGCARSFSRPPDAASEAAVTTMTSGASAPSASADKGL